MIDYDHMIKYRSFHDILKIISKVEISQESSYHLKVEIIQKEKTFKLENAFETRGTNYFFTNAQIYLHVNLKPVLEPHPKPQA